MLNIFTLATHNKPTKPTKPLQEKQHKNTNYTFNPLI